MDNFKGITVNISSLDIDWNEIGKYNGRDTYCLRYVAIDDDGMVYGYRVFNDGSVVFKNGKYYPDFSHGGLSVYLGKLQTDVSKFVRVYDRYTILQ